MGSIIVRNKEEKKMNFIDTKVDRDMTILGYLTLFFFVTISGTIIIYHNLIAITLVAMGISIIISGFVTVGVINLIDKRKNKQ